MQGSRIRGAARRRPCDAITRCAMCEMEHDPLPPSGNYMYPIPRRAISPTAGRTEPARCVEHELHEQGASMARHDRRSFCLPDTSIPGCAACVSIVHPSTASSSSFPSLHPLIRCPARTTDPSFRFRSAYHIGPLSIDLYDRSAARESRTRFSRLEFLCTVGRDFIIRRCNVDWQPFRR